MLGFGIVIYQIQYAYAQSLCDTMRNDLRNTLRASLGTLDFGKKKFTTPSPCGQSCFHLWSGLIPEVTGKKGFWKLQSWKDILASKTVHTAWRNACRKLWGHSLCLCLCFLSKRKRENIWPLESKFGKNPFHLLLSTTFSYVFTYAVNNEKTGEFFSFLKNVSRTL
jgi:hypothetical protein